MRQFVSYTLRDKELSEEFLKEALMYYRNFGDVFLDIITNDSSDKQKRVINELDNADKFILIETKSVYDSEWVKLEIERAIEKGQAIEKIKLVDLKEIIEEAKKTVINIV
ncbi:MAG: TIR domain-containing protein [Cyclobacteriaceae bacterium]